MNNRELNQICRQGTARILRAFELKLDLIVADLGADPRLSEAKRLLSDAIVRAETSDTRWVIGPDEKIFRVEKDPLHYLDEQV